MIRKFIKKWYKQRVLKAPADERLVWRYGGGNKGMGKSNQNKKTEDNGLKIRPVFPPDKIDWHKAQTLGPTEEELLTALYYDHSKWLEEVKIVCERAGIPLEQHLKKGLGLAIKDKRVRDCNYDTGLRLRGPESAGQDVLLFFVKKCPHACDALLRGEQPPYPWRISQPIEKEQKPAGTGEKEIVELKPGVIGITVDIKELARRFWKWVCSRSKD